MNKNDPEELVELKNSKRVFRFTDESSIQVGILILNRGEQLFYQENDNCFICEISSRYSVIFTKSIKRWSNGKKIISQEKKEIFTRLKKYYKKAYEDDVTFSDS